MNIRTLQIIEAVLVADSSISDANEKAIMAFLKAVCPPERQSETLEEKSANMAEKKREAFELITRKEAAKILGVHAETIKRYTRIGKLTAIKLSARNLRYRRNDVLDFSEGKVK